MRRLTRVLGWAAALGVLATGVWLLYRTQQPGDAGLRQQLSERGRLGLVGDSDLPSWSLDGTRLVSAERRPALRKALAASDPAALLNALQAAELEGLVVNGSQPVQASDEASIRRRLLAYDYIPGLSGVYLAPTAALYVPDPVDDPGPLVQRALTGVARGLLQGAAPPRIHSFPEPLRRVRNVEVLVMLREAGVPRLWRSARGSSIARALITASVAARQRWKERQRAMGGPLPERLPFLDLEVAILQEDGTLGARTPAFIERVFKPEHGVAYERKGAWRYLLPPATRAAGEGSAVEAYQKLLSDYGLPAESLQSSDLRLYRLVVKTLARAPARKVEEASALPLPAP